MKPSCPRASANLGVSLQCAYCDLVRLSQDLIDSVLVQIFEFKDHENSKATAKLFHPDVFIRALARLA
jgi:hypothetical protein